MFIKLSQKLVKTFSLIHRKLIIFVWSEPWSMWQMWDFRVYTNTPHTNMVSEFNYFLISTAVCFVSLLKPLRPQNVTSRKVKHLFMQHHFRLNLDFTYRLSHVCCDSLVIHEFYWFSFLNYATVSCHGISFNTCDTFHSLISTILH